MRILVVSNLYPPHHVGGYELGCRDVAQALRARGHAVHVLTSNFRLGEQESLAGESDVERVLDVNSGSSGQPPDKRTECRKLARVMDKFSPDVVYFWNQSGLCLWLPLAARWHRRRVAFFLSDTNFVAWRIGAWLAVAARKARLIRVIFGKSIFVRGRSVMQNQPCHFASDFLWQVAMKESIEIAPRGSAVVHWGIEPARFASVSRERWPLQRLLYVGQMIPQKGVDTAISALALLTSEKALLECSLTLVGGGQHPDYETKLRAMPAQLGIGDRIQFLGRMPRSELPGIYARHDVLVFPSEWDEPFAITPLEAMAAGVLVVGTTTGGSGELFRNRETAMTFATGDAADCARAIRELCADRALSEKIRNTAQAEVASRYTLKSMVDRIEASLHNVVGSSPPPSIPA